MFLILSTAVMNTEGLFTAMIIYKVQLKFRDHLVLILSVKMAVDGLKKPPLLPHCIKRSEETQNMKVQLTIAPSKFLPDIAETRAFLLKLLTFSFLHNDVESKWTYHENSSEQKNRQHTTHTNFSSLSCQTLFITLNMDSPGPFVLAQHSANSTQYTNKSPTDVF